MIKKKVQTMLEHREKARQTALMNLAEAAGFGTEDDPEVDADGNPIKPAENPDAKPVMPVNENDPDDAPDRTVLNLNPKNGDRDPIGSVLKPPAGPGGLAEEPADPDHDGDDDTNPNLDPDHDGDNDPDEDDDKDEETDLDDLLGHIAGKEAGKLPEEFKQKAAAVFESAVMSRVKKEVAKLEKKYRSQFSESVSGVKQGLSKRLDGYLSYVTEQWMTDNKLALESGVKLELMEGFITGMHKLFAENYVTVPADKVDLVAKLEADLAESKALADKAINENLNLKAQAENLIRDGLVEEAAQGLSELNADKFRGMVQDIGFKSVATFKGKLSAIRESYFGTPAKPSVTPVTSNPVIVEDANLSPAMKSYVKALEE